MKFPAVVAGLLIVTEIGCQRPAENRIVRLPAEIVIARQAFATQRFLPTNSGDLAFDTRTGSLCKTWNWHEYVPAEFTKDPTIYNQTRTCDYLYDAGERDDRDKAIEMTRIAKGQ